MQTRKSAVGYPECRTSEARLNCFPDQLMNLPEKSLS